MESQTLEEKIRNIDIIAQDIPAVIIIHQLENLVLKYMSPWGLSILKTTKEDLFDLPGSEYYDRYFAKDYNDDYSSKIVALMEKGDEKEIATYFQQVRSSPQEDYKLYLSTTKIFMKDVKGRTTHLITSAVPVNPEHHITLKVNRLIEENIFLKKNSNVFSSLTKREKEILKGMALGHNSDQIAASLHISETTVNTHRRNIRTKLNVTNNYELVQFAQAYNLI
ncbi:MAG: helix-turn-helix transcriptional regulator [Sporocytophaga sp.]|uniref:response regulator transcription factor n=1 Tax=Sporocytophaga sp. TaxID=2231183 RepID=UPI001B00FDE5|nr:helix-turn-helix transcriptional regulator [Sporocytophaga sp.]MBO9703332.1 helix-turn-helix transcriptional regulator [Sporocytophaga sp.]